MSIICLVRHGDRLDTNNFEEWQKSPRYKENSHDTPLSELGFAEILKHKGHIPDVEYIYTSPMTRCVQTALQDHPFMEDLVSYGNRMVKMINHFSSLHQRVVLLGHSGLVTFGAQYFAGNPSHFKLSQGANAGGRKHTGLLVMHNFDAPDSTLIINPDDL